MSARRPATLALLCDLAASEISEAGDLIPKILRTRDTKFAQVMIPEMLSRSTRPPAAPHPKIS